MHKEYKRIVETSDKAILFVHGIVGTPNHFDAFVSLVPENMSVYNILLDGHGKGVRDFSGTSMKKWEQQIASAVGELAEKHNKIYIAAHSMGCLLAIEQAVNHPKISGLFLLAVPLSLFLKPKMFRNSLKVYFDRIDPNDPEAVAAKASYGIGQDRNPLRYLGWVPRYLELFAKIRQTRRLVGSVKIPCVAYQSAKDEMVSKNAGKILEENPLISVAELHSSGHYYYEKEDFARLKGAFADFIS